MGCSVPKRELDSSPNSWISEDNLSKHKHLQSVQQYFRSKIKTAELHVNELAQTEKDFFKILNLDAYFFRQNSTKAFHGLIFHLKVNGKWPRYSETLPYLKLQAESHAFRLYEHYVKSLALCVELLAETIRTLKALCQRNNESVIGYADLLTEREWTATKKEFEAAARRLKKKHGQLSKALELIKQLAKETSQSQAVSSPELSWLSHQHQDADSFSNYNLT